MKIILLQDVPNLGKRGEVKTASDGYARNYLFPRGLAAAATDAKIREQAAAAAADAASAAGEQQRYAALAEKIAATPLEFALKAPEGGQVFGSVSAQDIADRLGEQGIQVKRQWIQLPHGIKATGEHAVDIRLPHHIAARVTIRMIAKP